MKISKLFHWLYATLMFLPLIALPIFGIYSHRHIIDSGSITREEPTHYTLKQGIINGKPSSLEYWFASGDFILSYSNNTLFIDSDDFAEDTIYTTAVYNDTFAINDIIYFSCDIYSNISCLCSWNLTFGDYEFADEFNTNLSNTRYSSTIQNLNAEDLFFDSVYFYFECSIDDTIYIYVSNVQYFNLTQIFGSGNEPTKEEFESLLTQDYYDYGVDYDVVYGTHSVTYDDTDIMSQFTYQVYNLTDKYLNFDNVFGLGTLYNWLVLNFFNGNPSIYFTMFWHLLTYWLIVSLFWLVFDILMYVPQLAHRWLDRGAIE